MPRWSREKRNHQHFAAAKLIGTILTNGTADLPEAEAPTYRSHISQQNAPTRSSPNKDLPH